MTNPLFSKSIKFRRQNKAFTLIELLVVISIIGMLSSVIMVSLQGARNKGRVAAGIKFATYNNRAFGADAIAYYNFNETTGTTAFDQSGNGITLTLYSGATFASADKVSDNGGSYLNLDGTNDHARSTVAIPSSLRTTSISKFTISAWINPDDLTANREIAILYTSSPSFHIAALRLTSTGMVAQHGVCYNTVNVSGVKTGKWQHVAVSSNGTNLSFYIDGNFISKPTMSGACSYGTPTANTNLYIGSYTGTGNFFDGAIDDVAIYTQSLTASDIQSIYAKGAAEHGIAIK